MKIRKIRTEDIDALIDLYKHYLSSENLPILSEKEIKKIWDSIVANPCINYFGLELDNKLISSCILSITPSFIRGGNAFGLIEHVVVHTEHRRKGVAQQIMRYTLDYAWENGCTEVMLLSGSQNTRAHHLYQKLGFDPERKKGFIIFKP